MRSTCHLLVFLALALLVAAPSRASGTDDAAKTKVTAGRMNYEFDDSRIFFENQVKVENPRFQMTSDRAVVYLAGTNDVVKVRATGEVVVTSSNRTARCNEAVYEKKSRTIVMYAQEKGVPTRQAYLKRVVNGKDDELYADKITIWLDSQRIDTEPVRIILDGSVPGRPASPPKP